MGVWCGLVAVVFVAVVSAVGLAAIAVMGSVDVAYPWLRDR